MRKYLFWIFLLLVAGNLVLAGWYVLHGDLHFPSDIARDFLLYGEIAQKKIVLIGGRTSSGLFHGPLWLYVNMPAYLLGNGNPVVVGWYWILLIVASLISGYFVARSLFNRRTAMLYTLLMSVTYVFHAKAFINPHGAMLVMPLFFYFFIRYMQRVQIKYLLGVCIVLGAVLQFQMAVGTPLLLMAVPLLVYQMYRRHKLKHLTSFIVVGIFLSNFILFDLKYEFFFIKKTLNFVSPAGQIPGVTYWSMMLDRVHSMLFKIEFVRYDDGFRNLIFFGIFSVYLYIQARYSKQKYIYIYFIYFFVGFFILSLINKGYLLPFYLYPLFPLVFLIFASFITSRYAKLFAVIFAIVYVLNIHTAVTEQVIKSQKIIGRGEESWKFLQTISAQPYADQPKEIGYFVYSPDGYAYGPQYAMVYAAKTHPQTASYRFEKKPVTYLLAAPPPKNQPGINEQWWIPNELKIATKPAQLLSYPNHYKLYRFNLTNTDITVPFNGDIDMGIHFR